MPHPLDPARGDRRGSRSAPAAPAACASAARSGAAPEPSLTTIMRGIGRSSSARPVPSQGSTSLRGFLLGIRPHLGDAGRGARDVVAPCRTSASMSRPATGRTWMVISRPTSDCQSLAAPPPASPAPVVSAARKVMMATTAASERPAIELLGTIGAAAAHAPARAPARVEVVPRLRHGLDRLNHRHAGVPHAAPAGARRTRPSARCRGWR